MKRKLGVGSKLRGLGVLSKEQYSGCRCCFFLSQSSQEHMHYYQLKITSWRGGKKKCRQCGTLPEPTVFSLFRAFFSASPHSLVFVLLFLAVGQRGTGADLAVSVQPLLHHLGDQGVVAAAGAFLHGSQHASFCHTAVQPFPQQLLLLLLVSHLIADTKTHS